MSTTCRRELYVRTRTRRTNMYCKLVGFSVPVSRSLLVSFATVCVHVCPSSVCMCESRCKTFALLLHVLISIWGWLWDCAAVSRSYDLLPSSSTSSGFSLSSSSLHLLRLGAHPNLNLPFLFSMHVNCMHACVSLSLSLCVSVCVLCCAVLDFHHLNSTRSSVVIWTGVLWTGSGSVSGTFLGSELWRDFVLFPIEFPLAFSSVHCGNVLEAHSNTRCWHFVFLSHG